MQRVGNIVKNEVNLSKQTEAYGVVGKNNVLDVFKSISK
jgi:hypothetical protein